MKQWIVYNKARGSIHEHTRFEISKMLDHSNSFFHGMESAAPGRVTLIAAA